MVNILYTHTVLCHKLKTQDLAWDDAVRGRKVLWRGGRVSREGDSANRKAALALRQKRLQHLHNPQPRMETRS